MLGRIKKAEIYAKDTIFWFFFSVCFIVVALFPQIAFFFSNLLGIESPANFVFLLIITILIIREFIATVETAKLQQKLNTVIQDFALAEHEEKTEKNNIDE